MGMSNQSLVALAMLMGAEQLLNYVEMSEAVGVFISVMERVKLKTSS